MKYIILLLVFFFNNSVYANTIKAASDAIQKKNIICEYPNMSWHDSIITSKILTEWKNYLYKA